MQSAWDQDQIEKTSLPHCGGGRRQTRRDDRPSLRRHRHGGYCNGNSPGMGENGRAAATTPALSVCQKDDPSLRSRVGIAGGRGLSGFVIKEIGLKRFADAFHDDFVGEPDNRRKPQNVPC
jgi:hypothetical protein